MVSLELQRKKNKAKAAGLSTWVWMKTQYPRYYCSHMLAAYARRRAKKQRMLCKITAKDILTTFDNQQGFCALTGVKLEFKPGMSMDNPSVDRIVTSKGYVTSNIRIVSFWANVARHNLSDKEFVRRCQMVVDYARN